MIQWPEEWNPSEGWSPGPKDKFLTRDPRQKQALDHRLWRHNTSVLLRESLLGCPLSRCHGRLPLTELREEVRRKGIQSSTQYTKRYREILGAPAVPKYAYRGSWAGWSDLCGTTRWSSTWMPLTQLQEAVRTLGIQTCAEYRKRVGSIQEAPRHPESYPGWMGWPKFLGTWAELISLDDLKVVVRAMGINSYEEYRSRYKGIPGARSMAAPQEVYADWVSWPDLFGRPSLEKQRGWTVSADGVPVRKSLFSGEFPLRQPRQKLLPLPLLKEEVAKLGITSRQEYLKRRREILGAGTKPENLEGWVNWPEFFGAPQPVARLTLAQLKTEVQKLEIRTPREYVNSKRYKEIGGAPSQPQTAYPDWVSWPDLFSRSALIRNGSQRIPSESSASLR